MNLSFEISYKIEELQILDNVKGFLNPGSCLTIMGPSGAGKSSLLNILTGKNAYYHGNILYNGHEFRSINNSNDYISYVEQEDIFYPLLSVKDHLYFHAGLRLPHLTNDERDTKVDQVLEKLKLSKCKNTQIMMLSGGEKKRLSIAEELLIEKDVMFLDEPTTGLDSYMADQVVEIIHNLAKENNMAIVYTIHQPSHLIYSRFDNILFLNKGKLFFKGTPKELYLYTEEINIQIPKFANPAEYLLEYLQINDPKDLKYMELTVPEEFSTETNLIQHEKRSYPSFFDKLYYIWWRTFVVRYRDRYSTYLNFIGDTILGVLIGLLFFQLPNDQASIISRNGAIFFIHSYPIFMSFFNCCIGYVIWAEFSKREMKTKGLYDPTSYYIARTTGEIPVQLAIPLVCFVTTSFFISGLSYDVTEYLLILLYTGIGILTTTSYGYMVANLSTDMEIVILMMECIMIPLFMFTGNLMNDDTMPFYFSWMKYLSPFRNVSELWFYVLWKDKDIECPRSGTCLFPNGNQVLTNVLFMNDTSTDIVQKHLINLLLAILISRTIGWLKLIYYVEYDNDVNIFLQKVGIKKIEDNNKE